MKKNILLVFFIVVLSVLQGIAQDFEGYIKYSYTIDLGAANNAKMAEANAKMNTPEMQAQIQAMKAKMNDPEFKKAMENNPQLKAQVEAMMAMSSQTATGNNFLPKEAIISFKNGNSLYHMNGGAASMANDVLYLRDKDLTYQIFKERKTYKLIPKTEYKKSTAVVTKTTETEKIMGYTCTKYIVKDGEVTMNLWATEELPKLYTQLKRMSMGRERNLYMNQVMGIPLKIESKNKDVQFTMTVTELKETPENAANFALPVGYTEEIVANAK